MAKRDKRRTLTLRDLKDRPQPPDVPPKKPSPATGSLSLKTLFDQIKALPPEQQTRVGEFVRDLSWPPPKPLPDRPPILWADAKEAAAGKYTPADHLRKYYRELADGVSMSRAEYRALDPVGDQALTNWLRNNELPSDIDVPTHSTALARRMPQTAQDKIRLGRRLDRQLRRATQN